MHIADETAADHDDVREVVGSAFAHDRARVVGLLDALQSSSAARPGLSLVAHDAGRVVGHVLLTRSWVDAPARLVEVLVLSPLSVAPAAQGRGVGTALVRAALARADEQHWPLVFLEGSPDYYGRRGFSEAAPLGFESPSVRVPPAGFQVATLSGHDSQDIGRLVYADPFWEHDCVGLRPS